MTVKILQKVEAKSLHTQVYDILKRAILAGFFRPGEKITIRGLAAQLGTSEMPVREALKRLVAQNAIEVTADRKYRIPILSHKKLKDVLELRLLLEGLATEQAAENMTEERLRDIENIHNDMGKAILKNDAQGMLEANIGFHFKIYSQSPNHSLLPIIESLWLQYSPTLTEYTPRLMKHLSTEDQQAARILDRERHTLLLNALKEGDAAMARKHIQADLEAFNRLVDRIGDSFADDFEQHRTLHDYTKLLF